MRRWRVRGVGGKGGEERIMGSKTKIDWCDSSWNPVTGCLHGCEYCYAQRIAERFGGNQMPIFTDYPILHEPVKAEGKIQPYPFDFTPTFHKYRLDIPGRWTRPRTIFVCSMADLFGGWVPIPWILDVFEACRKAPQHRFLFLTKNPERYLTLANHDMLPMDKNFWYGTSVTEPTQDYFFSDKHNTFISVEPILKPLGESLTRKKYQFPGWIIVGAETGNRKGKVKPEKWWIDELVHQAQAHWMTPVFMKESLRAIMGDDFRQEYPWEQKRGT